MKSAFFKVGHLPTLIACFLYFDASFAIWVLLGPLAVLIAPDLHLRLGAASPRCAFAGGKTPRLSPACVFEEAQHERDFGPA